MGEARLIRHLTESDGLIAVGTQLGASDTTDWTIQPRPQVQIDVDPGSIGKNYPATVGVVGDA